MDDERFLDGLIAAYEGREATPEEHETLDEFIAAHDDRLAQQSYLEDLGPMGMEFKLLPVNRITVPLLDKLAPFCHWPLWVRCAREDCREPDHLSVPKLQNILQMVLKKLGGKGDTLTAPAGGGLPEVCAVRNYVGGWTLILSAEKNGGGCAAD